MKRKYTVWGMSTPSADKLQFEVQDETTSRPTKTTVAQYFRDRYRLSLRYMYKLSVLFFEFKMESTAVRIESVQ